MMTIIMVFYEEIQRFLYGDPSNGLRSWLRPPDSVRAAAQMFASQLVLV